MKAIKRLLVTFLIIAVSSSNNIVYDVTDVLCEIYINSDLHDAEMD